MDDKTRETIKHLNEKLDEVSKRIAQVKANLAAPKEKLDAIPRPKLAELAKITPPTFGWVITSVGIGLILGIIGAGLAVTGYISDDYSTGGSKMIETYIFIGAAIIYFVAPAVVIMWFIWKRTKQLQITKKHISTGYDGVDDY